jgi:hypothetical protein
MGTAGVLVNLLCICVLLATNVNAASTVLQTLLYPSSRLLSCFGHGCFCGPSTKLPGPGQFSANDSTQNLFCKYCEWYVT